MILRQFTATIALNVMSGAANVKCFLLLYSDQTVHFAFNCKKRSTQLFRIKNAYIVRTERLQSPFDSIRQQKTNVSGRTVIKQNLPKILNR